MPGNDIQESAPHRCACCGDHTDAPESVVEDINGKELAFCSEKCEIFQMGVPADD